MQSGKIDIAKAFEKTIQAGLDILKQGVIQKLSETKVVQEEIEKQKVVAGKNILWSYFPYIFLGMVGLFMIARIK